MKVVALFVSFPTNIHVFQSDNHSPSYGLRSEQLSVMVAGTRCSEHPSLQGSLILPMFAAGRCSEQYMLKLDF
ncbi:hypothetical protein A2U01_0039631 [Trifolium medium]|uniref:Uncharacterized protein n=1 Tax=Trifolium medium TaxID=97028 RepID=A0A392Q3G0_9FABA|nr:hypothetical protein [Trifolium medium]